MRYVRYFVFQLEKASTGTPHVQGYCEFERPVRPAGLRRALRGCHVEKRRGTAEDAIRYCTKEDTRYSDPRYFGVSSVKDGAGGGQGYRSDLVGAAEILAKSGGTLLAVADAFPGSFIRYHSGLVQYAHMQQLKRRRDPPTVFLLVGPTGIGKSGMVYRRHPPQDLFRRPTGGQWFDGFDQQEAMLMDEYAGELTLSTFLQVIDRYPVSVEVKGGHAIIVHPRRIYIISNLHPTQWYRWQTMKQDRRQQYFAVARRIHHVYSRTGLESKTMREIALGTYEDDLEYIDREAYLFPAGAETPDAVFDAHQVVASDPPDGFQF